MLVRLVSITIMALRIASLFSWTIRDSPSIRHCSLHIRIRCWAECSVRALSLHIQMIAASMRWPTGFRIPFSGRSSTITRTELFDVRQPCRCRSYGRHAIIYWCRSMRRQYVARIYVSISFCACKLKTNVAFFCVYYVQYLNRNNTLAYAKFHTKPAKKKT